MGDMAEIFNDMKQYKKEMREKYGVPCPNCTVKLPKAQPKILLPSQRCWCGYKDARPRIEQALKEKNHG
jgi:hypothetical protein